MYAVAVPFWYVAVNRVRKVLTSRTVPVLALFAAFSFVLMMFNVPLPGGTTGHAVGGTLLAITLGPWAAVVGISVVLGIQALFFGDGGLLTFGANAFNMAVVLPLVGYFVYKAISSNSAPTSSRRLAGAVIGSYMGIVVAAAFAAVELGIQPAMFHTANGTPLYAPYGLNIALPAMVGGHMLIAGPIEAIVTGGVFAYLQRTRSSLIGADVPGKRESRLWVLWGALGVIALAVPLGLLASGTAWGEWGVDELSKMGLGFIPRGLQSLAGWWPAPFPDYGPPGLGHVIGYILSAFIGIALVAGVFWLVGRWLRRRERAAPVMKTGNAGRGGEGFLTKSVAGLTGALESVMVNEELARTRAFVQSLDPRVKLLTLVLFIVTVGLARSFPVLGVMLALALALNLLGRIPTKFFVKRVLLFLPLTAIIAVPALFITPGNALVHLGSSVVITSQGARTAGLLLLRVMDSVSFGLLIIMTTPWTSILVALRWFRLPSVIVDILSMTYRYVFLLLHTANSAFLARRSRSLGGLSGAENRRWLSRTLALTMARSQHLSEQVYLAMLSRGYEGETYVLGRLHLKDRDYLWAGLSVVVAAALIWSTYR